MRFALLLAAALVGCSSGLPPPLPGPLPPAPLGDAGPAALPDGGGDIYDAACTNLAVRGCEEGVSFCAAAMRAAVNNDYADIDAKCLAAATSKEAVRKCAGRITCP